jgi:hypothetical protein
VVSDVDAGILPCVDIQCGGRIPVSLYHNYKVLGYQIIHVEVQTLDRFVERHSAYDSPIQKDDQMEYSMYVYYIFEMHFRPAGRV